MRSLLPCLITLPFVVSCSGSSHTNIAEDPLEQQSTSKDSLPDHGMETITNSIGMKLALIPKGTFMMNSPEYEERIIDDENQQHELEISKDYYLGVYEVTQAQYMKVMGTNPSRFQKPMGRRSDGLMYPVERVSWEDAIEFCKKLTDLPEEKKAGRAYRLPTEAEWAHACFAGSKRAWSRFDNDLDYAWFGGNSKRQTHPVGEKKPNAWGLYDMYGNVWEWCSDRHVAYPKGGVGGWFRVALSPSETPQGDDELKR